MSLCRRRREPHRHNTSGRSSLQQFNHATGRAKGRLLRQTFIIALVLVSGVLVTNGGIELFFGYRENVEALGKLQQVMAEGAAFKIQQFVLDIEKTMNASTQTQEIVTSGLTEAYRFQLAKLLRGAPAITAATVVDANGYEQLKVTTSLPAPATRSSKR